MHLPIWATVFIGGIVGGWVGGAVSSLLLLPVVLGGTSPHTLASHWAEVLVVAALGQVAVTAVALMLLLPPLSDVRVGFGTSFVATLVGDLVVLVGTLLLLGATVRSNLAVGGGAALPAFGLASLFLSVIGIAVTATMIGSAAGGGGKGLQGYGGQSYLDEYRKG